MMKAAGHPPVNELQPDEARKMYRASRGALQPELPDVAELRDLSAPGTASDIPLRLYRGIGTRTGPLPVLVFYHGGGYVIGDLDTHDYVCRRSQMSRDAASSRSITGLRPSTNSPPPSKTPPRHCAGSCRKRKTFRSTRRVSRSAAIAPAAIYRQTWRIFRAMAKYLRCASRCFFIPGRT
jgi:Esterase/lipase